MSSNARILGAIQTDLESVLSEYPNLEPAARAWNVQATTIRTAIKNAIPANPIQFRYKELVQMLGALENALYAAMMANPLIFGEPMKDGMPPEDFLSFLRSSRTMVQERREAGARCTKPEDVTNFKFDSIAGLANEKADIEAGWVLPQAYPALFPRPSKGFLLYGPPGTGKTLLARAAASSLPKVAFINITAGQLKDKFIGETQKNIDALFTCAQDLLDSRPNDYQSAIIFLDEIDDIAAGRDGKDPYAKDSTNALLVNMDGFKSSSRIAVVGATNYPENVDGGVIRRFDQLIFVDLPDRAARVGIIMTELVQAYCPPNFKLTNPGVRLVFSMRERTEEERDEAKEQGETAEPDLEIARVGPATAATWAAMKSWGSSRVRRNPDDDDMPLTIKDISDIAVMTGPKAEAADDKYINRRKGQPREFDNPKSGVKARYLLGYSGSDLSKMMRLAISLAARAVVALDTDKKHFVPFKFGNAGEYYVNTYEENLLASSGLKIDEVEALGGSKRILNFTLTMRHIKQAIEKYPSSVKTPAYQKLAAWSAQG